MFGIHAAVVMTGRGRMLLWSVWGSEGFATKAETFIPWAVERDGRGVWVQVGPLLLAFNLTYPPYC